MAGHRAIWLGGLILAALLASELRGNKADEKPAAGDFQVGLVDLKQVFEKLDRLKEQTAALKKEVEVKDRELKVKAEEFKLRVEEHRKLTPDKQKEDKPEMEKLQLALKTFVDTQKKEFLKREAELYEAAYAQVSEEVGRQAQRRKMSLVLRMNDPTVEGEGQKSPEQILKLLNNGIVFHRPELNLTNDVIEALNGR